MPPKRKAAPASDQAPPSKRTTRSRGPLEETQPVVPAIDRPRRQRRATGKAKAAAGDGEEEGKATVQRPAPRRGRPRTAVKAEATKRPDVEPLKRGRGRPKASKRDDASQISQASSSKVTIDTMQASLDAEDSPDELLLFSPPQSRPATPERVVSRGKAGGTPRVVLDAVKIASPLFQARSHSKVLHPSPQRIPSTPPHYASALQTRITPVPTSPRKSATPRIAQPLLPQRAEVDDEFNAFAPEPYQSPIKAKPAISTPVNSPQKGKVVKLPQTSPSRLPRVLPSHLHTNLRAQKRAALRALSSLSTPDAVDSQDDESEPSTNAISCQQLANLLTGTVERGEGNSCLLIGPRGSGKTQIIERAIASLAEKPIVIRLSGHAQTNDRLAIREIAWQLAEQTGNSLLPADLDDDGQETNPFVDTTDTVISLPPPSHLLALISMIPTFSRPTIVILDAFDLFALHARQALLYCLLDTAQSCRVGAGSKGLAVVGVTTRVDTLNMLEKRVKSRFSGRLLRTACPRKLADWVRCAEAALCSSITPGDEDDNGWSRMWEGSVNMFFNDPKVLEVFRESFALSRDVRLLSRLLVQPVAALTPSSAFLTLSALMDSASVQRCPPRHAILGSLTYPAMCLLIAAIHAQTSGHDAMTFEMLHEKFRDQVRTSLSAPVHVEGGGIGMMRCSRDVMIKTFETMVSQRLFVALAPPAVGTGKEFVKYRCAIERIDVKQAVEKMGHLNLRKWFTKAQ